MTLVMDNFTVDITAWQGHLKDRCLLTEAMCLVFADNHYATHYFAKKGLSNNVRGHIELLSPARLTFFWHEADEAVALPFKLDAVGAADWAKRWLVEAEYGPRPDHDGSNSKGWRVFNQPMQMTYVICSIEPAWAMHGK